MTTNKITISNGKLYVPDRPTIPFIEGDGIGVDIWPATRKVIDAAVKNVTRGNAKLNGSKFWPEKKPLNKPEIGYQMKL
jgi:isocitrate dehydrogenase